MRFSVAAFSTLILTNTLASFLPYHQGSKPHAKVIAQRTVHDDLVERQVVSPPNKRNGRCGKKSRTSRLPQATPAKPAEQAITSAVPIDSPATFVVGVEEAVATSTLPAAAQFTTISQLEKSISAIQTPTVTPVAAATPAKDVTGTTGVSADQAEYLKWHNVVRAQHNAVDLTWSTAAEAAAQAWANKCVFQHGGGKAGGFGENLAAGTGGYTIKSAVTAWTDEESEYDPANPQFSHYTQVVWRGTTQVGCAVASCDGIFPGSKANYYVCEYFPPGNVIGQFAENVQ